MKLIFTLLTALLLASLVSLHAAGAPLAGIGSIAPSAPQVGAREPLSYQTMGLYAAFHGQEVADLKFDFLIPLAEMGVVPFETRIKTWNGNLSLNRAAGKRVIANLYRVRPAGTKVSRSYSKDDTDFWFAAIDRFLSRVAVDELYAVTLGEENIFWDGRHQMLTELYHRVKAKYPTLPVYQWYSNSGRAMDQPGFVWPWLPADGWMVNEYSADAADFEQLIRRHRLLGTPVIAVAWAAPEQHYSIPFHPSIFAGQLRVAQRYNVPMGYFCHQDINSENPAVKVNTWGWVDTAGEKTKKVFKLILDAADAARKTPSPSPDTWDLLSTPPQPVQLAAGATNQSGYREDFDLRMQWTGETAPKQKGHWDFMQRMDIAGLRHLRWRPQPGRLSVIAEGGTAVAVVLKQHWMTDEEAPDEFTIVVQFTGKAARGVKAILEASANGHDWTARAENQCKEQLRLVVPGVKRQIHTRLRISGAADVSKTGKPLAEVDWIEVTANKRDTGK